MTFMEWVILLFLGFILFVAAGALIESAKKGSKYG